MTIRAAGGVVWRDDGDRTLVAIIHRPDRRDWSLPKGKLDDGEDERTAAVREVREEIGSEVEVLDELGTIDYTVTHAGRSDPKTVRYWSMRHLRGAFAPNDEVDELRWLPLEEGRTRLTYDRDREVLDRFATLTSADGP